MCTNIGRNNPLIKTELITSSNNIANTTNNITLQKKDSLKFELSNNTLSYSKSDNSVNTLEFPNPDKTGKNNKVDNDSKSEKQETLKFSLPESADLSHNFTKDLFNTTFNNITGSSSAFSKAKKDLDTSINTLDKKIAALDTNSPEKAKLVYMKQLLGSMKDIYSVLASPDKKGAAYNLIKKTEIANNLLKNISPTLSPEDVTANLSSIKKFSKIVGDYQNIAVAFLNIGGKGNNISNNLNKFSIQTFERLREIKHNERERKSETEDIKGAIQSYSNDITDMQVFLSKISELSKKLDNGSFKNRNDYVSAMRAIAPKASNEFKESLGNIGNALYSTMEAKQAIARAAKSQKIADEQTNQAQSELNNAKENVSGAEQNVELSKQQSSQNEFNQSKGYLNNATNLNGQAQSSINKTGDLTKSANSNLGSSRNDISIAKIKLSQSGTSTGKVESGKYSKDLKSTTSNIRAKNSAESKSLTDVQQKVNTTQNKINQIINESAQVQNRINNVSKNISGEQSKINDKLAQNDRVITEEDKKILVKIANDTNNPALSQELEKLGGKLFEKSSDGKRIIDQLSELANSQMLGSVDKNALIKSIVDNLNDRSNITQGPHGTCGAASLEFFIINENPAEYVKLVTELATKGESKLKDGTVLKVSDEVLNFKPDTEYSVPLDNNDDGTPRVRKESRSWPDILVQSAFMEQAKLIPVTPGILGPEWTKYNPSQDGSTGFGVITGDSAANPYIMAQLMKSFTGRSFQVKYNDAFINDKLSYVAPVASAVKSAIDSGTTQKAVEIAVKDGKEVIFNVDLTHYMTIKRIENGNVFYKDTNRGSDTPEKSCPVNEFFKSGKLDIGNDIYGDGSKKTVAFVIIPD